MQLQKKHYDTTRVLSFWPQVFVHKKPLWQTESKSGDLLEKQRSSWASRWLVEFPHLQEAFREFLIHPAVRGHVEEKT